MTSERLRAAIRVGIYALVLLAPLPFGSVEAGYVLAIELIAAGIGVAAVALIALDADARVVLPRVPLALCGAIVALGIFQLVPFPFRVAESFNPTAELVRPLIPYIGLSSPPAVSWSVAPAETTDALLRFVAYVWIGLGAALAFDTAEARKRFSLVLVASAVFQAVYGSGEYLTGRQHIFAFAKKHYLDSATGTFINRNHFATFLAMALPFAMALSLEREHRMQRRWRQEVLELRDPAALLQVLAIAGAALIWLGLLLSHSRAGLVASLVAVGIVLSRLRSRPGSRALAAVALGIIVLLLMKELGRTPGERFLEIRTDLTAENGRFAVWRDSLWLLKQRPVLGWGFGTFETSFPAVQSPGIASKFDHAHNDWLEWAVEGGLLVMSLGLSLAWWVFKRSRSLGGTRLSTLETAAIAGIAAVAFHAWIDFSLRIPAIGAVAATTMGLLLVRPSGERPLPSVPFAVVPKTR